MIFCLLIVIQKKENILLSTFPANQLIDLENLVPKIFPWPRESFQQNFSSISSAILEDTVYITYTHVHIDCVALTKTIFEFQWSSNNPKPSCIIYWIIRHAHKLHFDGHAGIAGNYMLHNTVIWHSLSLYILLNIYHEFQHYSQFSQLNHIKELMSVRDAELSFYIILIKFLIL